MSLIWEKLFGCFHKRLSFPLTKRRGQRQSAAASVTGTYIVCLDCGKEFAYSWQEMRIIPSKPKAKVPEQRVKEIAHEI